MNLSNKVFVVIGAGNGIGRQVALELVRRGGRVAAADVNSEGLEQTRNLADSDAHISTHVVDVTDQQAVETYWSRYSLPTGRWTASSASPASSTASLH